MASNTEMFSFDDVIVTCYWQKMGSTYIFNDHVLVTLVLRQLYVDVTVIADAIHHKCTCLQNTWQINFISIVQSTQIAIISITGISIGDTTRYEKPEFDKNIVMPTNVISLRRDIRFVLIKLTLFWISHVRLKIFCLSRVAFNFTKNRHVVFENYSARFGSQKKES